MFDVMSKMTDGTVNESEEIIVMWSIHKYLKYSR